MFLVIMISVGLINSLKFNLFYVTIFTILLPIKGKIEFHGHYDKLLSINTTSLIQSLHYTFHKHYCAQIITDRSFIAYQIITVIHNLPSVPTFLIGATDRNVNCNDYIYLSSNLKVFIELLKKYPIVKQTFYSVLTNDFSENLLHQLIDKDTSYYLNNSNGVIVDLKDPNILYKYHPLHNSFKVLMISDLQFKDEVRNFGKRKLKVGTFNCSINSQIGPLDLDGKPGWFEGVEMNFFDAVTRKLNFTYEIVLPSDGSIIGTVDKQGKWSGGLMKLVGEKLVDIAFCGIWRTGYKSMSSLDMTSPIHDVCITYLVQRPLPFNQMGLGLLHSFQWEVWALVGVSLLVVAMFMQIISFLQAKFQNIHYEIMKSMKFSNSLLNLWAILCNNAPKSLAILGPRRHVLVWWAIVALLLNTFFSSSLISHLTKTLYRNPADSCLELVKNDYTWCLNYYPMFGTIFNLDNQCERKWVDKFCFADVETQCGLIEQDNSKFAIFAIEYEDGVLIQQNLNCKNLLQKYQTIAECVNRYRTVFLLQHKSPYSDLFSDYITRYRESGIFIKEYRDMFQKIIFKENYVHEVRLSSNDRKTIRVKLKLSNILMTIYLFLSGIAISILIFFCELFWCFKSSVINFYNCFKSQKTFIDV